eukprot:18007-Prymnesium_polylepis.1
MSPQCDVTPAKVEIETHLAQAVRRALRRIAANCERLASQHHFQGRCRYELPGRVQVGVESRECGGRCQNIAHGPPIQARARVERVDPIVRTRFLLGSPVDNE